MANRNLAVRRIKTVFTSSQDKHRRLWRLAVATQPPIAEHQSAPCPEGTRIYQKPTASSEGAQLWDKQPLTFSWFRKAGPTILMCQSPFGELYGVEVSHVPTAALLRSLQWVSDGRSRFAEPAAHTQSAVRVGAWLRRDAIASYVCHGSLWLSSNNSLR